MLAELGYTALAVDTYGDGRTAADPDGAAALMNTVLGDMDAGTARFRAAFDALAEAETGTFYLTDFLAHHYEGLVIESLGLDRYPELRDTFFGNYEELLYLRQIPDQDESERAREAAARLGLAYKEADSGLDVLEERLVKLIESQDR